jgi:dUTPase
MRSIDTKLSDGALAPVYKTTGAAGADLFAHLPNGPVWIPPGEIRKIPSGVHFDIRDTGLAVLLMPRSDSFVSILRILTLHYTPHNL